MSAEPKKRPVTKIQAPPAAQSRALDFDQLIVEQAKRVVGFKRYIKEMWERRSLVQVLSGRKLKSEYEMNIVGFAWWLLEPLSLTGVYYVLVTILQANTKPSYVLFILSAMLAFKWMQSCLVGSMATVRQNASLVQDVYFPRALLPLTEVTIGLAHFLVGLIVIPPFMLVFGVSFRTSFIWLPVVVIVQFALMLGLAYPLAVWGLNYRNLPGLIANVLRLWFYLSPTLWDISRIKNPTARLIVHLNPLTGIFQGYRSALGLTPVFDAKHVIAGYTGGAPGLDLLWSAFIAAIFLFAGGWYFSRREAQFGKML
ncbi:MAG: ABC transporter permease [Actinobacteria bacterium]|nr:ABC transporter permease [Actinomycetota bacterium]